ncbi:ubiquitin-conjugating enzyme/RWD-like protein, partial [Baffinella frigidus]
CGMPGAVGTDWEGGVFPVTMNFPPEYPVLPPKVKLPHGFVHCNVYPSGTVCQDILQADSSWEPSITVKEILRVCQHSLDHPNPLSPTQEAGYKSFTRDRAGHSAKCKAQAAHFTA